MQDVKTFQSTFKVDHVDPRLPIPESPVELASVERWLQELRSNTAAHAALAISAEEPRSWLNNIQTGRFLAQHNPSAAYLMSHSSRTAALLGMARKLPDAYLQGRARLPLVTRSQFPGHGELKQARDGFKITGRWTAIPGLDHADWLLLGELSSIGRTTHCVLLPKQSVEYDRCTYLGGLSAAGFHTLTLNKHYIADDQLIGWSDSVGDAETEKGTSSGLFSGALYDALCLAGLVLGSAEGTYGHYRTITKSRVAGVGGAAVSRFTQVQARVADAHATLKVCAMLFDALTTVLAEPDSELDPLETSRDASFIARRCVDVVTTLVRQMGAMGLSERNPVQHYYRDVLALAATPSLCGETAMISFGRREFGLDTPIS